MEAVPEAMRILRLLACTGLDTINDKVTAKKAILASIDKMVPEPELVPSNQTEARE
jgi:hypothetical protein